MQAEVHRRVVITGVGVVAPNGIGVRQFWAALVASQSAIGPITLFDATRFASRIAGEVRDFVATKYLPHREVVRTDRFIQFAMIAADEAIAQSGLDTNAQPERFGVCIGTGMGGVHLLATTLDTLSREGPGTVSAYAMPGFLPNMAAGWVSIRLGARGPIGSPTTACAAGSQAIGDAFRAIQRGEADAMVAGGTDALVNPVFVGAFCSLRALSTRNDDPMSASRPFDRDRDGFVIAEGAGMLVLEELSLARQRGATILAEICGYGITADASHPTTSTPDGPARAMSIALRDAGAEPREIDYINAHGTSTKHNDANETQAIRRVFGQAANDIAVSSTKSMTGHMIGAAGAVEAVVCVLAMQDGIVPATINLDRPDHGCDLDYVANAARKKEVRMAMSNSFAFGGINSSLIFRRFCSNDANNKGLST
jgi:3-oxoacyl-[acyl-carrier-protein] synthase II